MKTILAFLCDFGQNYFRAGRAEYHDDSLRANQGGQTASFSFWRALVS